MADAAHKPEVKKTESNSENTGGKHNIKEIVSFFTWVLAVGFVIVISFVIVVLNEKTALDFIKLLSILIIGLGLYLVFLLYKFWTYTVKFKYWASKIEEFYTTNYKPEIKTLSQASPNIERLEKAKKHINSNYKEEWKIGIIELDNILRDLLKDAGYVGETVADLLNYGASKGMKTVDLAWEAHKVRNRVVHEGTKYDFSQEEAQKILRKYISSFEELGIH